jgi:prepilin-type N-terminal cleavage/methylation domain-containing protein
MNKKGFTLIEMVVVLAVIAIPAAILTPTVARNIKASKVTRTINETQVIAAAVASLYKDTGYWPYTGANGPAGGVDRVLTNPNTVPTGAESGAGSGAAYWGTYGLSKPLYDYLYYNNPDDDTGFDNYQDFLIFYASSAFGTITNEVLCLEHYGELAFTNKVILT